MGGPFLLKHTALSGFPLPHLGALSTATHFSIIRKSAAQASCWLIGTRLLPSGLGTHVLGCGGKWRTADQTGRWCAAQAHGHHVRRQPQCCWLFFFRDSDLLWVYVYVWAILIFKSGRLIKHGCELGYKCTGYQCNLPTLFWCLQPHVKNTREIRK